MTTHRSPTALSLAALLLIFAVPGASGGLFSPKPVKKSPGTLLRKQAPPKIDKSIEGQINPDNSTVLISISKQRAYLKIRGTDDVYIETPISSGRARNPTPAGNFTVLQKNADHRSSIYGDFVDKKGRVVRSGISSRIDSAPAGTRYLGAPMKFFSRLTWSGVGMHVGILPGYPASHGCIRLPADIAPLIYQKVKLGTPVTVVQ
ncbi:MAG: L,D-transpeptidase family protein [Chthoniobacteraceae bacterium]